MINFYTAEEGVSNFLVNQAEMRCERKGTQKRKKSDTLRKG